MPNQSDIEIDRLARRIVELSGNAGVTQRCVPLAAGGLDPDARVNYEFGLVLGVEEFRQEQFYHLQKEYLHNRGLHGYGVVSGLEVSPERTADNDVRVNVGAGVGIDQCGRTFTIRSDQCAYLRAWLERHRQRLSLTEGPLSLYVIGTYDECQDALVSIAGQPCASSEQSLAASRIRDSFNITLSATPPAMPAWESIRRLAVLMARVRVVEGLPEAESDEAEIAARVRVIDDPVALDELDDPPEEDGVAIPPHWLLPAQDLPQTLDRLFMIWVTEVRPRLAPAVIDGCGASDPVETGVLLGRLDLNLTDAAAPIQFNFEAAAPTTSLDGRPYLMQTQAIQELLSLGGGDERLPPREFATLMEYERQTLRLWIHHPEAIEPANPDANLEEALRLTINEQLVTGRIRRITETDALNLYELALDMVIPANARIEARFLLAGWRVYGVDVPEGIVLSSALEEQRLERLRTGGTTPLLASIDLFDFAYVGRDGNDIVVYGGTEQLPEVSVFAVPTLEIEDSTAFVRLWFPFDAPIALDETALRIQDDSVNQSIEFRVERKRSRVPHVWWLRLSFPRDSEPEDPLAWLMERVRSARLQFVFNVNQTTVNDGNQGGLSLIDAMTQGRYSYVGYDEEAQSVSVPYVPDLPAAAEGLTERDVLRIIEANRQPIPKIVPLADLRYVDGNQDSAVVFELWFHLDLNWELFNARVEDDFTLFVLGEIMDGEPGLVELNFERERVDDRPNVFRIIVFSDGGFERLRYLRFIFLTQEQFRVEGDWGGVDSLREAMDRLNARFENTYDIEGFTGAPAVVLYGRVMDGREG